MDNKRKASSAGAGIEDGDDRAAKRIKVPGVSRHRLMRNFNSVDDANVLPPSLITQYDWERVLVSWLTSILHLLCCIQVTDSSGSRPPTTTS